jgi:hypothetical protein
LIGFNLLPAPPSEEPVPVPGRASETRMLLVHYWRRDQIAFAEAEAAAVLETDARPVEAPVGGVFVNGEYVTPQGDDRALPPPAPALDPNRPDFLSSLKSRVRPPSSAPAGAAGGSLFVDEAISSGSSGASEKPLAASPAASLFSDSGDEQKSAAGSIFAEGESPLSAAERLIQENLAILAGPRPEPAKQEAVAEPAPAPILSSAPDEVVEAVEPVEVATASPRRQTKIRALESFLKRVASRRQQIESESVA